MAEERLIVSNTTPIINLAEIGRLDVLQGLFGKVVVPPAVVDELLAKRALFPKAADAATCFEAVHPEVSLLARGFRSVAHAGEAECLALAMEHPGSLLILDDLQARALASANGISVHRNLGLPRRSKGQRDRGCGSPTDRETPRVRAILDFVGTRNASAERCR